MLDSDLPPREKMMAYVGAYFDFIASNQIYPKLMQREMMRAREGDSTHIDRLVKTYFQPIYRRLGELLAQGIADGEFRKVDPAHFIPSMVAMIVFYFSSAPVMQRIVRFNPLTPQRIAERRAAVLDFISAALFQSAYQAAAIVRKQESRTMSARNRFFILLGIIFVIAAIYYTFPPIIPRIWC